MIPIGDDNSTRRSAPVITYALLALNIFVFFMELSEGREFIMKWSFIPTRFLAHPIDNISTLFTAMFMHAGWAHLIGNMLYLWIFGDNVEDHFGKAKFLFFYLLAGLAATFAQLIVNPGSNIPNLGASGAIAGVLGAYILLFPKGKIDVMVGHGMTQMPAIAVIGFWFLLQFVSGIGTLASTSDEGGVAYMAHIGGFIAGLAIAFLFRVTDKSKTLSKK